jgi:hypothetical protein
VQVHKGYHMQLHKFVAVKRVNAANKVMPCCAHASVSQACVLHRHLTVLRLAAVLV